MTRAADRINEAADLWAKGHTAAEIARKLGLVSKHAVNQLAHRNRALFPQRSIAFHGEHGRAAARGDVGDWSEADIAKAAAAWRDGKTSGEIARMVGRSRSAVVGVMHRHRNRFPLRMVPSTQPKPKPSTTTADTASLRSAALGTPRGSVERPLGGATFRHRDKPVFDSRPTPFMALAAGQCRWPLVDFHDGSGADMPCCGAKTRHGSYCGPHANRAAGSGTREERRAERTLLRHGRST